MPISTERGLAFNSFSAWVSLAVQLAVDARASPLENEHARKLGGAKTKKQN